MNKNWLKENWFKLFMVLVLSAILYFQFMRPLIYKKYCAKTSYVGLGALAGKFTEQMDEAYRACLRKYGI